MIYRIRRSGTGLFPLGWSHYTDGSSSCRLWLVILFLPVLPRGRYRVVTHGGTFDGDTTDDPRFAGLGISLVGSCRHDLDIPATYLKHWLPFIALLLLIFGGFQILTGLHESEVLSTKQTLYILPVYIALLFGGPIAFALYTNRCFESRWNERSARDPPDDDICPSRS